MRLTPMKILFSILTFVAISVNGYTGTCTSVSRTNSSANSILTSTKYNSDLNTLYTQINALDGGCVTDGTVEAAALNTTDFAVILNAVRQGCKVTRTDAATVSIDKCFLSVNGNWVRTTTATTATWGCGSCASESASTTYYLYAATGSSGSTLTPLISTSAPNNDGYDSSGNRVLGKFYNNHDSNIVTAVEEWYLTNFVNPISNIRLYGCNGKGSTNTAIFRFDYAIIEGDAITYADDSVNATSFTINQTGIYSLSGNYAFDAGANFGFSYNSNLLTTAFESLPDSHRLTTALTITGNQESLSWTGRLYAGDVVRLHNSNAYTASASDEKCQMIISKISN